MSRNFRFAGIVFMALCMSFATQGKALSFDGSSPVIGFTDVPDIKGAVDTGTNLLTPTFEIPPSLLKTDEDAKSWRQLSEILDVMAGSYHRAMSGKEYADTIKNALVKLDPHSAVYDPTQTRMMQDATKGKFGGLGIDIGAVKKGMTSRIDNIPIENEKVISYTGLYVTEVYENKPGAIAGIQKGDIITGVVEDGKDISFEGKTPEEMIEYIRGAIDSYVILYVSREGVSEPQRLAPIQRKLIEVPSVEGAVLKESEIGTFGYVIVKIFSETTVPQLKKALAMLRHQNGDKQLAGLVLDFRKNPGGLLDATDQMLDLFLPMSRYGNTREMVTLWLEGRNGARAAFRVGGEEDIIDGKPLVALISGGSASASEIVVGALQVYGRTAAVAGTPSFGKGSVQTIIPLDTGGALRVTTEQYLVGPCKKPIQGVGVQPDILLKAEEWETKPDFKREKDLPNSLPTSTAEDKNCKYTFSASEQDKKDAYVMINALGLELAPQASLVHVH